MKDYILQGNCDTCQLITLLNASIKHKGYSPLSYDTPEYWDFAIQNHVAFERGGTEGSLIALEMIEAKRERFDGYTRDFTKWVRETILNGGYIDCGSYVHHLHSFLISEYFDETDTYEVINAQIFTNQYPIEILPLPVILKSHTCSKHTFTYWTKPISVNNIHKGSGAITFS